MLCSLSSRHSKWTSRVLLAAVVLLCTNLTAEAAPPAQEKPDAKESPVSFRAYLPTIRLKALRDNERKSVADLNVWVIKYDLNPGLGVVTLFRRPQIEEEYHRSRLRALRLDADYRDSLGQFTSRHRVTEERRWEMEDAATSPLTKPFQRFEELYRDAGAAFMKLIVEIMDANDVATVRPGLIKILTESTLVKNTKLPKRFLKSWDEWKKINEKKEIMERTTKNREALTLLRKRELELWEKEKNLSETDLQRRENLRFETVLGELQDALLTYEKQPWKAVKDDSDRSRQRGEMRYALSSIARNLLDYAYRERLNHLYQSWSGLAPVKVKDVDLLACKPDKAEETVASLLKTPVAQPAGKKKVRHIRALAES